LPGAARVPSLRPLVAAAALASFGCGTTTMASPPSNPDADPAPQSSSPDGSSALSIPCASANVPSTLRLTATGFTTCVCFNGAFALTRAAGSSQQPPSWSSPAITGCPGQQDTAYFKLSASLSEEYDPSNESYVVHAELGLGITDEGSEPGSGNSDFAPATNVSCAPFAVHGAGSQAGNISAFCPGVEDESMQWSISE
jgi:hypothetical protein